MGRLGPTGRRDWRSMLPLAVLVLGLLTTAPFARAALQDPTSYRGWQVSGFDLKGVPAGLEGDLKKGLFLSGRSKFLFWKKYPYFSPDALQRDIDRTLLFLARNGFPSATAEAEFRPDPEDREVDVVLQVEAGPRVLVEENRVTTFPAALKKKAEKVLALEEGERYSDFKVEDRVARLLDILKEGGYAYGRVTTRLIHSDPTHVTVEFVVDAGEIHTFGPVRIQGVGRDLIEVAERYIAIDEGSRYSPKPIRRAGESLRLLDLFRQVRIEPEAVPGERIELVANLDERKMQSLNVGVGYWTEDQIRATLDYKHRNLLRAGRGVGLTADYSRFLQETTVSYWKPTLFHSRTRGSLTLRGRREAEPRYTLRTGEIELAATYLPSTVTTVRPSIVVAFFDLRIPSEEDSFEVPGPNLIAATFNWIRADMDDRLNPSRGHQASVRLEAGWPGFKNDRNYTLVEPEVAYFFPLLPGLVAASRIRLGLAGPMDNATSLLPNKRLYAGGAGSMRGTKRRRLGPLDAENRPIGGVAKVESTVELRFPIVWRFAGAVFVDAGQVWQRREDVRLKELRFAAGPGLSLRTPIGPVRGDVGFLLGPRSDAEGLAVFHVSIGTSF